MSSASGMEGEICVGGPPLRTERIDLSVHAMLTADGRHIHKGRTIRPLESVEAKFE